MKQILLPTDFSENSLHAIAYALEIFKAESCHFFFLHIHPIPPYSGAGSGIRRRAGEMHDEILANSRKELEELLIGLRVKYSNPLHSFVPMVRYDFFIDGIRKVVWEHGIDFIFMGTKGATGLKKLTLGSNTGDVITKVQCPMIAVPAGCAAEAKEIEIAFATDFRIPYDAKVLDTLLEIVSLLKAHLDVVHINGGVESLTSEQRRNKQSLDRRLEGVAHSYYHLSGQELESAIQCFVQSRHIGMLAMIAKNLNFFQRILFRPRIEKISYHTQVPFLVLHESIEEPSVAST